MDIVFRILIFMLIAMLAWAIVQINTLKFKVNLLENRFDRLETKNKNLSDIIIKQTHEAIIKFLESEVQEND